MARRSSATAMSTTPRAVVAVRAARRRAALPARQRRRGGRAARPAACSCCARASRRSRPRARRSRNRARAALAIAGARRPAPGSRCSATSGSCSATSGARFLMYGVQGAAGSRWAIRSARRGRAPRARLALPRGWPTRTAAWPVFYEVGAERSCRVYLDLGLTLHKLGEEARRAARGVLARRRRRAKACARRMRRRAARGRPLRGRCRPSERRRRCSPSCAAISDAWLAQQEHAARSASRSGSSTRATCAHFPVARRAPRRTRIVAFANVWAAGEHARAVDRPDALPRRRAARRRWTFCSSS